MKFLNSKEKLDAQGVLKEGVKSEFWRLITEALTESREALQRAQDSDEAMRDLPPEQYKVANELYRIKREFIDTLSKMPENIISWLVDPKSDNEGFDPYDK